MSYWYERYTKKHILVFCAAIPVALLNSVIGIAASYSSGCVPTAARTLHDWISPERGYNYWEIHPFVKMALDPGCVEWLGFSTCEVVQFQDWMPFWMQNELVTIHIFNVTTVDQGDSSKFQTAELSPMTVDRIYSDHGTAASLGQLDLKRKVTYNYNFDSSRLDETVVTGNPKYLSGAVTSPWTTARLSELLGVTPSGFTDLDIISARYDTNVFVLPAPTNKYLRYRSLFYFKQTSTDDRKCLFDADCAQQCSWTETCEPLSYGNQGTLLPSATLFFGIKGAQEFNHWPIPAWDYRLYCPNTEFDRSCWNEKSNPVIIFNPQTFSREIFHNTGTTEPNSFQTSNFNCGRVRVMHVGWKSAH